MNNGPYQKPDRTKELSHKFFKTMGKRKTLAGAFLAACLSMAVISCAAEKPGTAANPAIQTAQLAAPAARPAPPPGNQPRQPRTTQNPQLAPLPAGITALSLHSPYADGNCSLCHQRRDPQSPGPLFKEVNEICLDCHVDFSEILTRQYNHAPALGSCVNCHNPHNAPFGKLLMEDVSTLCLSCHSELRAVTTEAEVKHDVVIKETACINCHNAHGANVEHLLISLPFDLCVTCHGVDGLTDDEGRTLTNFQELLAENPEHHGPIKDKDCSACHNPHGAQYFRLLNHDYPARFYSPYQPELYGLCFECHEESTFEEPRTSTLTLFRDGDRNLHYLHVNKEDRGRTCRACHEVHAAKQKHHIREGVPYGSKGWVLKINYTPTPTGGACGKNCHDSKSYNNQAGTQGARR